MEIRDDLLRSSERLMFVLRRLFTDRGYQPYRMSRFEEYDLYAGNKDFLVSDNVITFNDRSGRLMALRPDVTLSIIKNGSFAPEGVSRLFYSENVYRVPSGEENFREIMQIGAECFGGEPGFAASEAAALAAESMKLISDDFVLALSDLDILRGVVSGLTDSEAERKVLYRCIEEKNPHAAAAVLSGEKLDAAKALMYLAGPAGKALSQLAELPGAGGEELSRLAAVVARLEEICPEGSVTVDMSLTADMNYYNGVIFKGYVSGLPAAVLSGGQYDSLMRKLGKAVPAAGFAVYAGELDREAAAAGPPDGFVNVALPKGRLGEKSLALFAKAGLGLDDMDETSRKLIFEDPVSRLRAFWVKPSDVPIYVARGAADIGIAGKDVIMEHASDVFELLDLKTGRCRMAVAAPNGFAEDASRTLRVATKYPNIAEDYYRSKGRDIDIIVLNGSIELAPLLGLSDVIVDIVETGKTLRENDMSVTETVADISARLIANKSSFRFKRESIEKVCGALSKAAAEV